MRRTVTFVEHKFIYVGIPHCLMGVDPVLNAALHRVTTFYTQTFWYNAKSDACHRAAISLVKRGEKVTTMFF